MATINKIKIGDTNYDLKGSIFYGVCDTDAATAEKIVTVDGNFTLYTGVTVAIKFVNANSASVAPALNVNGTGSKAIARYGETYASTGTSTTGWRAGAVQIFVYDGTSWIRDFWENTTYSNLSLGQGYGTCSTAEATQAKVVTMSSYTFSKGGVVTVKFTNAVPASSTLNINSKGAKAIYYRGATIKANVIKAGDTATFMTEDASTDKYHLIAIDRWQKDIEEILLKLDDIYYEWLYLQEVGYINTFEATSDDGIAYIATTEGYTASDLYTGCNIIIVPDVNNAANPTLKLGNTNAVGIRYYNRLNGSAAAVPAGWLKANKPYKLTYDGTYWILENNAFPIQTQDLTSAPMVLGGYLATDGTLSTVQKDIPGYYNVFIKGGKQGTQKGHHIYNAQIHPDAREFCYIEPTYEEGAGLLTIKGTITGLTDYYNGLTVFFLLDWNISNYPTVKLQINDLAAKNITKSVSLGTVTTQLITDVTSARMIALTYYNNSWKPLAGAAPVATYTTVAGSLIYQNGLLRGQDKYKLDRYPNMLSSEDGNYKFLFHNPSAQTISWVTPPIRSGTGSNSVINSAQYPSTASGVLSFAFGESNNVAQRCGTAFGIANKLTTDAVGDDKGCSFATGWKNTIDSGYSFAIGDNNTITKKGYVFGSTNDNNSLNGFIVGSNNIVDTYGGGYCLAIGDTNHIQKNSTHVYALGSQNSCINTNNEGTTTISRYNYLFGYNNTAGDDSTGSCVCSVAIGGKNTIKSYNASNVETGSSSSLSKNIGSVALGFGNTAGTGSTSGYAIGTYNTASGTNATAMGYSNTSSNQGTVAIGYSNSASASGSVAIGSSNSVTGNYSCAVGYSNNITVMNASAFGYDHTVSSAYASAIGYQNTASGNYAIAAGKNLTAAARSTVFGHYNDTFTGMSSDGSTTGAMVVLGRGTSSSKFNLWSIQANGDMYLKGTGQYKTGSGDYAEYFEWSDGNVDNEDRRGRFVTIDENEKIRFATADDDYILGIVSGCPGVLGDAHEEDWKGRFLRDIYNAPIYEEREVEAEIDEESGEIITPAHTDTFQVENPEYDPTREYIGRKDRPEWSPIGMLGKLTVDDDGTCEVGGFAAPGKDGIATRGTSINGYKVIARLDENHVRVIFR